MSSPSNIYARKLSSAPRNSTMLNIHGLLRRQEPTPNPPALSVYLELILVTLLTGIAQNVSFTGLLRSLIPLLVLCVARVSMSFTQTHTQEISSVLIAAFRHARSKVVWTLVSLYFWLKGIRASIKQRLTSGNVSLNGPAQSLLSLQHTVSSSNRHTNESAEKTLHKISDILKNASDL